MTLKFDNAYIKDSYSFIGRNEYELNIKGNEMANDYYMGKKSFELGEVEYQKRSIKGLLNKNKLNKSNIDLLISGDLQNQLFASYFAGRSFKSPILGIYSACSTFLEGLFISAMLADKYKYKNLIVTTSANNLASEKQFRFPIEYGAIRKVVNTFTVSASTSTLVTSEKTHIKIESATVGKVVDIGYKDANNMGACMAPGAALTISEHLKDLKRKASYYDIILTGDLGIYGSKILKEYLDKEYDINLENQIDAGEIIFNNKNQIAGGSGPVCLPLALFDKILKNKKYKKILLVGTGSLHSKLSTGLSLSIPSISHAISLEVE